MKKLTLAVLLAAIPLLASAQDPVKVDPGHYKVILDNDAVRVLKVRLAVGEKSPMHSHPDAIIVPLSAAKARFTMPDGKTEGLDLVKETAAWTPASTHSPANVGTSELDGILVEFKSKTAGTATLPTTRPGMQYSALAETPRAVAMRATAGPDFHEPAGSTHEFDQVVIGLGAADMTVAMEGKPKVTTWQRGDVLYIGRGVKHESKNTGGKPVDFIVVAIR